MELLIKLLFAHAVSDFALQSDAMAMGKNRHNKVTPPPGQEYKACWPMWLIAHGLINGCLVYLATGSLLFGVVDTVLHASIDYVKCEGTTNPYQDQGLHIFTKVIYCAFLV